MGRSRYPRRGWDASILFALFGAFAGAQDLAAGTEVLVLSGGVRLYPATMVEKVLDGYKVKLSDGKLYDVPQSELAFDLEAGADLLKPETRVAGRLFGDYYANKISEIREDGYQVFFGEDFGKAEGYDQVKAAVVGKEFKVGLALVIGGASKTYEFAFKVEDLVKTQGQGFNFVL